jgi:outer membrane protein TolC
MRTTRGVRRLAAPVSAALSMIAAALVARAADAQAPWGRTVSLAQCVAIALRENPDAQSSEFAVQGAEAQRAEVRGAFGPKLQFDGNIQQWSSPFRLFFGGQEFTVRQAQTLSAGISLIQPITTLLPIYQQYKIQEFGVDVAAIRRAATRREVAFHTIESYYRLLEAERLADVASASVTQLEAQEKQAQSQFDNGLIGKNDLLRAALALASARQRAIQTDGQVVLARGQLATAMGRSPDEAMEPEPFSSEPPELSEPGLEAAEGRAAANRLELRDLARQVDQAQLGVSYAKAKLGPVVNAVGNYTHTGGLQPFQPADAAYVGLAASWNLWDWGTTLGGVHEADAKLQQAILARKKLEDAVRLEARQAFVNAQSSRQALDVARTAVSQAEENFRIVTKKFENNAATSFDVVDAEALLTQSRGQVEQALYDYLIAAAALQKATGAALPGEGT